MRGRLGRTGLLVAGLALAGCQDDPGKSIREAVDQSLHQGGAQAAALGGWREAAASFRPLYERNPDDLVAALGLIRSLRNAGQLDEAMRIGAAVTAKHPDDAALLGEYGKARLAARDLPGALETLGAAASRAPADWSLPSAMGIAYDLRGEHEKAQEAYLAALTISPNNPSVMNNLALSLALSGNLDGGIARLETLAPPMRGSAQARQSLALLYAVKGETAKAEPLLRRDLPDRLVAENLAYLRQVEETRPAGGFRPAAPAPAAGVPVPTPRPPEAAIAPVAWPVAREAAPPPAVEHVDSRVSAAPIEPEATRPAEPARAPVEPPSAPETTPAAPREAELAPTVVPAAERAPGAPIDAAAVGEAATVSAALLRPDLPSRPAAKPAPIGAMRPAISSHRIQLGALRSEEAAREEWERLRRKHPDLLGAFAAQVSRVDLGERGVFWRLQAGPIADGKRAERLCDELKRRHAGCVPVPGDAISPTEREARLERLHRQLAAL
jgi:Flp pilus assembly protein TadD/cell division septation protein DedD